MIAKKIRKLQKPFNVHVFLDNNKNDKPYLSVVYRDGSTALLPINKKVAEVLIARGMAFGN